jgi:hypothetical protein
MSVWCIDCDKEIFWDSPDYYMVDDLIWADTGLEPHGGLLCLNCLETRIGRQITVDDLSDAMVNDLTEIKSFLRTR